jgi:hypothetical protein
VICETDILKTTSASARANFEEAAGIGARDFLNSPLRTNLSFTLDRPPDRMPSPSSPSSAHADPAEALAYLVERATYYNDETGFCVLRCPRDARRWEAARQRSVGFRGEAFNGKVPMPLGIAPPRFIGMSDAFPSVPASFARLAPSRCCHSVLLAPKRTRKP